MEIGVGQSPERLSKVPRVWLNKRQGTGAGSDFGVPPGVLSLIRRYTPLGGPKLIGVMALISEKKNSYCVIMYL